MSEITASMVKDLREKTGAGMMDCKRALNECSGIMDDAIDWLRKKGLASARKKAERIAADGVITIAIAGTYGVMLEINSETDFVAKNEKFQALAEAVTNAALKFNGDLGAFMSSKSPLGDGTVEDEIMQHVAIIGENINLRRMEKLSVTKGVIAEYIHNAVKGQIGKKGALVAIESNISADKLAEIGKHIAMHIVAATPIALDIADLDADLISKEREILREQAMSSGKPQDMIEKMIDGRMRKFYEEVVLLEQTYAIDGKTKITSLLDSFAKQHNGMIRITQFIRYAIGEGIEK